MAKRLRPLSGLDAAFLYLEAAGTPMHVGSVMLLQAPKKKDYDFRSALAAHVRERLPRAAALRRVLHDAPLDLGHPLWAETQSLDLDAHITQHRLIGSGSRAQLWKVVAELHAKPLPRDRPLWQFVVIDGLASGELVLYSKIHHALLDGQGGMALAQALLDLHPLSANSRTVSRAAPATQSRPLRSGELASSAIRATTQQFAKLLRALPTTFKLATDAAVHAGELIGRLRDSVMIAPRTLFNAQVGAHRSYAVASLPLADVKAVAHHFDASVNDVVLALCSAALRDYLQRRNALPRERLVAAMPISLRVAGDSEVNNQVSMVQCALPTDIADPVARLLAISAATGQLKRQVASFRSLIPTDFPGLAAPIWATGLSRLWARGHIAERLPSLANLVVSNIPGPPVTLFLAGRKVLHYFPVSIVTHGLGLNITVNSYAGSLEFGLIACRDIAPRLESLATGLGRALRVLVNKAHK